ncbi:hypothetical protein SSPO_043590 [Streptomyces antimycoticus]|uniref:Uncharacterized protein n=1 Tax=Streptomyces antimycoticus TaxID=68175 RepID=A0A499UWH8_9ACTN|nr:hypothetical protein SSPO_043590 [Streptomyces antimycoticus]
MAAGCPDGSGGREAVSARRSRQCSPQPSVLAAAVSARGKQCQCSPSQIGLVIAAIGPGTPDAPPSAGAWRTSARTYAA